MDSETIKEKSPRRNYKCGANKLPIWPGHRLCKGDFIINFFNATTCSEGHVFIYICTYLHIYYIRIIFPIYLYLTIFLPLVFFASWDSKFEKLVKLRISSRFFLFAIFSSFLFSLVSTSLTFFPSTYSFPFNQNCSKYTPAYVSILMISK